MPIVRDLSGNGNGAVDKSFCKYNRKGAGSPSATITPEYAGEIYLDTTGNDYYTAKGTTNDTWVATQGI